MSLFNIDYNKLINLMLPVRLRKPVLKAWLGALIVPVKYIYGLFTTNRNNDLYYLAHNSQVVYLQAVLNDTFDFLQRRIVIMDNAYIDPVYAYEDAELKGPSYAYLDSETTPLYMYQDGEISPLITGFIVQVPTAIITAIGAGGKLQMSALIDKYRLPSKNNYSIVSV